MTIEKYISDTSNLIKNRLSELIIEKDVPYNQLFAASRYALLGEGKRLRPLLLIATAESLGCTNSQALNAACAIEMIHTYSMIHDDLPCMDNDDFRRGKPTVHRAFPEAHAVLAGDYLLTYAFETLVNDSHLSAEQKIALVGSLARGSGGHGMIAGQIMDIEAEGKTINHEHLQLIHRYKTGALITTAIEMGAIVGNADKKAIGHLKTYGDAIGLAFQIVDDIIDFTASEEKHGKKISSDVLNDKMTYVKLYGLDIAKEKAKEQVTLAVDQLNALDIDSFILNGLAQRIIQRLPLLQLN